MENLWPLVVMWILFAVIGGRKKRGPGAASRGPGLDLTIGGSPRAQTPEPQPRSLPDRFREALEELKRAEMEAMGKQSQAVEQQAQQAETYLAEQKRKAEQRLPSTKRQVAGQVYQPRSSPGRSIQRTVVPLEDDDADKSSEDVFTPEGVADYDDDAERIAAERRKFADRPSARRSGSIEELTPEQAARRAGRPHTALGGRAEHDAWHDQMHATGDRGLGTVKAKGVLAKYADGTLKSALILSEILGTPKGQR